MKPLVHVSLVGALNDPNQNQENLRLKLEPVAQKSLDAYFTAEEPSSSRSLLNTQLAAGWLVVDGRKVRFEAELDGATLCKEAANLKELDELIGDGKTPGSLLRFLAGIE